MQANANGRNSTRNFHGQKKQLLNQQAGRAPPSWKQQQRTNAKGGNAKKSKILLSELPTDVSQDEVVALFAKTIGPVNKDETFMVYNNQGTPRGMAIVTFQREADAYHARERYHGKLIDSRKPIKIEIVKDEDAPSRAPPPPAAPPSLLQRLGGATPKGAAAATSGPQPKKQQPGKTGKAPTAAAQAQPRVTVGRKLRQKKGPRRVKKAPVTAQQLDADMDAYRVASEEAPMV